MTSSSLLRLLAGLGAALTVSLAGCGSGTTYDPFIPTRMVVFGDGFSAVNSNGETLAGVRNTTMETNSTVASRLASYYGLTITPAPVSGTVASTGGFYFAGSSPGAERVADVASQIRSFLSHNTVQSGDMFFITVGALDIYDKANLGLTAMDSTVTNALANAIQQLTNAGAKHVLYMMPINMARTPWGLNPTAFTGSSNVVAGAPQALSYDTGTNCNSFQCKLTLKLSSYYPATSTGNPVLVADIQSYFNLLSGTSSTGSSSSGNANTYLSYGIYNPDLPVCTNVNSSTTSPNASTTVTLPPQGCSSSATNTGVDNSAWTSTAYDWTTSLFADNLFLTPFGNRLLADYIYGTLMYRAGWR